jgi:hypothetical protein
MTAAAIGNMHDNRMITAICQRWYDRGQSSEVFEEAPDIGESR